MTRLIDRLSIIVPTRNEAPHIEVLLERLEREVPGPLEVIFVDDSDDNTPAVIEAVRAYHRADVVLIHQSDRQKPDRKSGAILTGLEAASSDLVCVMNPDLHDSAQLVRRLRDEAHGSRADVVVGSQHYPHSTTKEPSVVSFLAHLMFPGRLPHIDFSRTDFFLVRKDRLRLHTVRARGYSILLEILVRHPGLQVAEVDCQLHDRRASGIERTPPKNLLSLSELCALRLGERAPLVAPFLAVGATGIVVNMLAYALAIRWLDETYYLLFAFLAVQLSMLSNFVITDVWVFRNRQRRRTLGARLTRFFVTNNVSFLLIQVPVLYVLVFTLGNKLLSNFISLLMLAGIRFASANVLIGMHKNQQSHLPPDSSLTRNYGG